MNRNQENKEQKLLFKYLSTRFKNLSQAITWFNIWVSLGQPTVQGIDYSQRAMAAHCSHVLENKLPDTLTPILAETKWGTLIFLS